jgi:hypothetical protein
MNDELCTLCSEPIGDRPFWQERAGKVHRDCMQKLIETIKIAAHLHRHYLHATFADELEGIDDIPDERDEA